MQVGPKVWSLDWWQILIALDRQQTTDDRQTTRKFFIAVSESYGSNTFRKKFQINRTKRNVAIYVRRDSGHMTNMTENFTILKYLDEIDRFHTSLHRRQSVKNMFVKFSTGSETYYFLLVYGPNFFTYRSYSYAKMFGRLVMLKNNRVFKNKIAVNNASLHGLEHNRLFRLVRSFCYEPLCSAKCIDNWKFFLQFLSKSNVLVAVIILKCFTWVKTSWIMFLCSCI